MCSRRLRKVLKAWRYEVNQGFVGCELRLVMNEAWVFRRSESVELSQDNRSSSEDGWLRMSWETRISLVKACRSMEPVTRNEWVGGGGRTKGLIGSDEWSAMIR